MERRGCRLHDLLVERELQRQQVLSDALASAPAENGNGHQRLARRGVGRQAAALPTGMDQYALLAFEPVVKRQFFIQCSRFFILRS